MVLVKKGKGMLLALETAQAHCSVALSDATGVLAFREDRTPREQTRQILPMIEAVMAEVGVDFAGLQAVAFARGPGSFSGIRINTAVAQALGWAHGLPLLPVSSLQALAQSAQRQGNVTACMGVLDARMQEVYAGAFMQDAAGLMQPAGPEQLCAASALQWPEGWSAATALLVGDGAALVPGAQQVQSGWCASAVDIARLGWVQWQAGLALPAHQALPVYLRDDAWKKIDAQRAARQP
jgi:tRNA threonylcarbamoyladenosine biosynthesis protein TsaB